MIIKSSPGVRQFFSPGSEHLTDHTVSFLEIRFWNRKVTCLYRSLFVIFYSRKPPPDSVSLTDTFNVGNNKDKFRITADEKKFTGRRATYCGKTTSRNNRFRIRNMTWPIKIFPHCSNARRFHPMHWCYCGTKQSLCIIYGGCVRLLERRIGPLVQPLPTQNSTRYATIADIDSWPATDSVCSLSGTRQRA